MECNNKSECHNLIELATDNNATRVICSQCYHQYVVRKDWRGVPENRQYSKVFRRDSLQPNTNLFYKYYPQFLLK